MAVPAASHALIAVMPSTPVGMPGQKALKAVHEVIESMTDAVCWYLCVLTLYCPLKKHTLVPDNTLICHWTGLGSLLRRLLLPIAPSDSKKPSAVTAATMVELSLTSTGTIQFSNDT